MDPVSALGIAAAVFQFIQFGSNVVSQARQVYTSTDGALLERIECEAASKRLLELSDQVKLSIREPEGTRDQPVQPRFQPLQAICDGCMDVSNELQVIL